jgi:hypothetical protein
VNFFWRESIRDGIYGNAVNLVRSANGTDARYIGSAACAFLEWRVQRHLSLQFDHGHFFADQFIMESGPGQDVNYFSSWLTFASKLMDFVHDSNETIEWESTCSKPLRHTS